MNQQVGDEDLSQKSNYGKSIEDAKSLIKQLEAFKNIPATTAFDKKEEGDAAVSEKSDKNDMVTYELFYTPETAKMQKEDKLSDIDERIAKIEKLVGSNAGQALDELVSMTRQSDQWYMLWQNNLATKPCFYFPSQLSI